jgi:hypothetical protein
MTERSGENVMIYEMFPCSIPWHYKSARYNVHNIISLQNISTTQEIHDREPPTYSMYLVGTGRMSVGTVCRNRH